MKRFIQLSFLFLIGSVNAQSIILFEQDTATQIHENVDLSDMYQYFTLELFYKNNTDEFISVNWRREFGENCPTEWDVVSGDVLITYLPNIDESQSPIPLSPSDSNFFMGQFFYPRGVAGCCDIKMIFSLEGDPDNPIDTGYYFLEVNADGCLTASSVVDQEVELLQFYPNPTSDVLNIEGGLAIESIEILDLTGRVYTIPFVAFSKQVDLSALHSGIYIFRARSRSGELWVGKFYKR